MWNCILTSQAQQKLNQLYVDPQHSKDGRNHKISSSLTCPVKIVIPVGNRFSHEWTCQKTTGANFGSSRKRTWDSATSTPTNGRNGPHFFRLTVHDHFTNDANQSKLCWTPHTLTALQNTRHGRTHIDNLSSRPDEPSKAPKYRL